MKRIIYLFLCIGLLVSCDKKSGHIVKIKTSCGDIKIRLYDETPLHRDNFLKLAKEGYYKGMLFHRVIENFMIQAGDPESRGARSGLKLGAGGIGYTIKPEINPRFFHKKGTLCAAREGDNINPTRESDGSHFYISQGRKFTSEELAQTVDKINEKRHTALFNKLKGLREAEIAKAQTINDYDRLEKISEELSNQTFQQFDREKLILSDEQIKAYTTIGGIPHLDGNYTIFGEVIEGIDVLDKIAAVETDGNDRPVKDVVILKMEQLQ